MSLASSSRVGQIMTCLVVAWWPAVCLTAEIGPGAALSTPPSFRHDIVPVLTRYGCSAGACHGKLSGQNGFSLSLRGYAPEADFDAIARQSRSRRIRLAAPESSLLLAKPLGRLPHGGGAVLPEGSAAHSMIAAWIAAGAPAPLPVEEEARLEGIEVEPRANLLAVGQKVQLRAMARYSDGRTRDVTWLTRFESNDSGIAEVTAEGEVTVVRPGETVVRAAFQELVEIATFTAPYPQSVDPAQYAHRNNLIDDHVFEKLASLRIEPAPLCSDEAFVRRAFLDTIGILPRPQEVRDFLADSRPEKRELLIEQLLDRPEFVDFWALQLGDLLQNRKDRDHDARGDKGVQAMHHWLRAQVAANRSWSEITRAVLSVEGDSVEHPQLGYLIVTIANKPAEESEVPDAVAQTFLGTRIGCARCHNHPLERYTQDDFYHFAAFFSRVALDRRKAEEGPTVLTVATGHVRNLRNQLEQEQQRREKLRTDKADPAELEQADQRIKSLNEQITQSLASPIGVTQPRTGQFLPPRPLDRTPLEIQAPADPRLALLDWITQPDNEYFAGAMVNRLWKHFLGVGLVEPVDDLRATNPPSNPALWQALVGQFVDSNYDLKHLIRLILLSRTYQLDSATASSNANDARHYSHYYPRRLPAEVLLDAISQSTAVPERFPGFPVGVRAQQLPGPTIGSYFLSLFGRSERITACACERDNQVSLPQLLHLQNGESVLNKIKSSEGYLAELLASGADDLAVTEALFLSTLCRYPAEKEIAAVKTALTDGAERREVFEDLFWALLNSKEFAFNH